MLCNWHGVELHNTVQSALKYTLLYTHTIYIRATIYV